VVLYAFRSDSAGHQLYRTWLESVVENETPFGMSPQVLAGVVRLTTNRRVFVRPSVLESVLGFVSDLSSQPHCQIIQPGPHHWRIFCDLCRKANATGNLVQDAWFAALAIESGCEWITLDRDFARFPGLRWRTPTL